MSPYASIVFEPEYRLLFRDNGGQEILQYIFARDDSEAMMVAKARCHGLAVEIWQERRRVGSLSAMPPLRPVA